MADLDDLDIFTIYNGKDSEHIVPCSDLSYRHKTDLFDLRVRALRALERSR